MIEDKSCENSPKTQVSSLSGQELHASDVDLRSPFPTPAQIQLHLRVLHAFRELRASIAERDGLFDLDTSWLRNVKWAGGDETAKVKALVEEKRWQVYVTRAVYRFTRWWEILTKQCQYLPVKVKDFDKSNDGKLHERGADKATTVAFNSLPPIDVLMVWHSYLLNPRLFLEDCLLQGMMPFWHGGFPWREIAQAMDSSDGSYVPPSRAREIFEIKTKLPWDNLDLGDTVPVACSRCLLGAEHAQTQTMVPVAWSTAGDLLRKIQGDLIKNAEAGLSIVKRVENAALGRGVGYAEAGFQFKCHSCFFENNVDSLTGYKFIQTTKAITGTPCSKDKFAPDHLAEKSPVPGTFLDSKSGRPIGTSSTNWEREYHLFPMRLIDYLVNEGYLEGSEENAHDFSLPLSLNAIETELKKVLDKRSALEYIQGKTSQQAVRVDYFEKCMLHRVLTRYRRNHSPFALDLVAAVIRQGSFIQKVVDFNWLHDPNLESRLDRMIVRYGRFMRLCSARSYSKTVPTLDIDLVWHTHQLFSSAYYRYSVRRTEHFVNHDDNISENDLSKGFANTSDMYFRMYKEPYSTCHCWYCEAIKASQTPKRRHILKRSPLRSTYGRSAANAASRMDFSTHVSAHAIYESQASYRKDQVKLNQQLERFYAKACGIAKHAGKPKPTREMLINRENDRSYTAVEPIDLFLISTAIHGSLYNTDPLDRYCSTAEVGPGPTPCGTTDFPGAGDGDGGGGGDGGGCGGCGGCGGGCGD